MTCGTLSLLFAANVKLKATLRPEGGARDGFGFSKSRRMSFVAVVT